MSIFGRIKDAIFGKKAAAAPVATPSTSAMPQMNTPSDPNPATAPAAPVEMAAVDVEAMLNEKAAAAGQPLNWRTSIVDLMKLLDIDSSLANRKELATELGYTGDMNDSATMNIWLHKHVMRALAEHGGHVPAELTD